MAINTGYVSALSALLLALLLMMAPAWAEESSAPS